MTYEEMRRKVVVAYRLVSVDTRTFTGVVVVQSADVRDVDRERERIRETAPAYYLLQQMVFSDGTVSPGMSFSKGA